MATEAAGGTAAGLPSERSVDEAEHLSGRAPGGACTDPWTDAERDEWRAMVRRDDPALVFAPSSEWMAAHYGERNLRDRLAELEARRG